MGPPPTPSDPGARRQYLRHDQWRRQRQRHGFFHHSSGRAHPPAPVRRGARTGLPRSPRWCKAATAAFTEHHPTRRHQITTVTVFQITPGGNVHYHLPLHGRRWTGPTRSSRWWRAAPVAPSTARPSRRHRHRRQPFIPLPRPGPLPSCTPSPARARTGAVPQVFDWCWATDGNFYGTTFSGVRQHRRHRLPDDSGGRRSPPCTASRAAAARASIPRPRWSWGANGNFYGTTSGGGGTSTVFQITPGGALSTLHTLSTAEGLDEWLPILAQGSDGNFYGTSYSGGANSDGHAFPDHPGKDGFTLLYSLNQASACQLGRRSAGSRQRRFLWRDRRGRVMVTDGTICQAVDPSRWRDPVRHPGLQRQTRTRGN